jgi:lysophospholipase L1-like esterase
MNTKHLLAAISAVLLIALLVGGCKDTTPSGPNATFGNLNIKSYVSIGNSITAGYQSNGLYESAQMYSYPNLLTQQLNISGSSVNFVQPLWSDPGTPYSATLNFPARYVILGWSGGKPVIGPNTTVAAGSPENLTYAAPYNNLAVPGAFIYDFLNAKDANTCYSALGGSPNALFTSTLRGLGTQFQQLKVLKPELVTFWLGNNDVLGYATSGGKVPSTAIATFTVLYKQALDSLRAAVGANTPILVANIPDVTTIPFVKTIPSQGLVLSQGQADALNTATGGVFQFTAGVNGFLAFTGTGTVRKLTAKDYVLLTCPQDSLINAGWGSIKPIPNQYVLDTAEVSYAKAQVTGYNAAIAAQATSHSALLVDVNSVLVQVDTKGYAVAGEVLTSAYVSGGAFSLDGVHPSNKGQGLIANAFIKVMNSKLATQIPYVDIANMPGIASPVARVSIGGQSIPYVSPEFMKNAQLNLW